MRKFALLLLFFVPSCSMFQKQDEPSDDMKSVIEKPLSPEKSKELLGEAGSNWLYGQGVGETALTAGSIIVFPPYALYVLANGIMSVSGYKPIYITDALPEKQRTDWNDAYNTVTSGPGHLSAALAGREYRTKEVAKEKISDIIHSDQVQNQPEKNEQP